MVNSPLWRLGLGLLLAVMTMLSLAAPARGQGLVGDAPGAVTYLNRDAVRDWDIDLVYRYQRDEAGEVSLPRGYQVQGQRQIRELAVTLRRRLAPGWVGVLQVPFRHHQVQEQGWVLSPSEWRPFRWEESGWQVHPIGLGWRREGSWYRAGDVEWGADVFLGGGREWRLVARWRWGWLRDPVLLRVGLEAPWRFAATEPARAEPLGLEVGIDHAINSRLVVSGALGLQAGRLVPAWGWSLQVLPDRYWNVRIKMSAQGQAVTVETGWRVRL